MKMNNMDNDAIDMVAAAILSSRHGLSQKQICSRLQMSAVKVSRLLKRAKSDGFLRLVLDDSQLPTDIRERAEARVVDDPAVERWKRESLRFHAPHLKTVNVLRTVGGDPAERLAQFTDLASSHVLELIRRAKCVGVAWGVTIAALVKSMQTQIIPARKSKQPIEFVPLTGEPLGVGDLSGLSSSKLARELDLLINGGERHSSSLRGIPDIIPWEVPDKELPVILRLFEQVETYRRVFGHPSRALSNGHLGADTSDDLVISQLDCVVTSISKDGKPWRISDESFMRTGRLRQETLESIVVGDIAGVVISRDDVDRQRSKRDKYHQLIERWTGIKLPHLRRCADRSAEDLDDKRPGVIAVCAGKEKTNNLTHVLNVNLVNHLIVDYELAKSVAKRASARKRINA